MSKKLFVCPNCNLGFKAEWRLTSYIVCPSCKIKIGQAVFPTDIKKEV